MEIFFIMFQKLKATVKQKYLDHETIINEKLLFKLNEIRHILRIRNSEFLKLYKSLYFDSNDNKYSKSLDIFIILSMTKTYIEFFPNKYGDILSIFSYANNVDYYNFKEKFVITGNNDCIDFELIIIAKKLIMKLVYTLPIQLKTNYLNIFLKDSTDTLYISLSRL